VQYFSDFGEPRASIRNRSESLERVIQNLLRAKVMLLVGQIAEQAKYAIGSDVHLRVSEALVRVQQ
jgi:hypothetical protein